MKKILTLAVAFLIIFSSCSNYRDALTPSQKTTLSTTKKIPLKDLQILYNNMINSDEHKKLTAAEDAYWNKVNYTGDGTDLNQGAHSWILANIKSTKFTNIQEAEEEWEIILEFTGIVAEKNSKFFAAFGDEENFENISYVMINSK